LELTNFILFCPKIADSQDTESDEAAPFEPFEYPFEDN
jgi:hypothetical protein